MEQSRIAAAIERFSRPAARYSEPRPDFLIEAQTATVFHLYIDNMCRFVDLITRVYPVAVRLLETHEGEAHYILVFTEHQENPTERLTQIIEEFLPLCKQFSEDEEKRLARIQRGKDMIANLEIALERSRQKRLQLLDQIVNRPYEEEPIF